MNQDFIVSTLVDENDGDFSTGDLSLREAIAQAESGNTITFDSDLSGGTINLSLGELAVDKSLTINGLGAENIIIDGGGSDNFFDGIRVFNINDNSDAESQVVINDLTITGGGAFVGRTDKPSGAGIYNTENLEINNAIIRDNTADLRGGGIFSEGTLTVKNSAIYNNSAQRRGAPGGGIANAGTAAINQSTIANNNVDARSPGGGIYNEGNLTVSNSTVSGNSDGIDNNGEATLVSTIVAGNSNNSDLQGDDIISGGNNLIGGEATSSLDIGQVGNLANIEDSDIVGTADNPIDPQLGELQNNGGATPTQALQEGSPAIDVGSNPNNLATDQRGKGFNRTAGNGTDIGAFEVQESDGGGQTPTNLVVSTLEDENDGDFSAGDLSLREAIAQAESGDTIIFDSILSGGTITLASDDLIIDKSLTIEGLGANQLTIDAGEDNVTEFEPYGDGVRVFRIDDGNSDILADVTISGLTITGADVGGFVSGGNTINDQGGGIFNTENLKIDSSIISNNQAITDGGGIYNEGMLTVSNSTIDNNSVATATSTLIDTDGGGIYNRGTAKIINSTITNNVGTLGGGISSPFGELSVTNSTITGNSGIDREGTAEPYNEANGAGIFSADNQTTITSSIIANNRTDISDVNFRTDASNSDSNIEITSNGDNLIGNGNNVIGLIDSDIVGTTDNPIDPQLGELQNNGGVTLTQALLEESPAIDAGSNPDDLETDQRGVGFDRTVGNSTDIGAFEVQDNNGGETPTELVVSTLIDENDGDFSAGDLSLREAIAQAESGNTITFDSNLNGGTINLSLGELAVDKSLTINGLGAENIVINGGGSDNNTRVFKIDDNSNTESKVVINDLTITGGSTAFSGSNNKVDGAGIFNKENLEINNAIVRDNSAETSGGGISSEGTLTVNNSAIYNNTARRLAGGGIFNTGTATINQSTISSNTDGGLRGGNGGGIGSTGGTLNVNNSTVTENRSSGIGNSGGEVTLTSTIVAENSGNNDIEGDDFISGGNNFIGGESGSFEVTSAGGFTNGENGDIVAPADVETTDNSIDPQLGELQDNGGATPTQALQEGSPAIDVGSNPNNLATDQRGEGFNRTVGNGTDIGAFEVQEVADNRATEGNDTLIGTDGNDLISGLGGDDLILGKDGHDSLNGNNGKDIIFGDAGDDLICGGNGNDLLFGGEGNDTIDGGAGKDIIFGGSGNNTIADSVGEDIIIDDPKNGMSINGQEIGSFLESYGHDLFSLNNVDAQNSIAEVASNSDLLVF